MKHTLGRLVAASFIIAYAQAVAIYYVGDENVLWPDTSSTTTASWGTVAPIMMTYFLNVGYRTVNGSSTRTYARDGYFYNLVNNDLQSGDKVIIEFGRHDEGGPTSATGVVDGEDDSLTQTVLLANGTYETVHTFGYYIKGMITQVLAKGATPIISSRTPDYPYATSNVIDFTQPKFVVYAGVAAAALNAPYVNHYNATLIEFSTLPKSTVDAAYTSDGVHTTSGGSGAYYVSRAFIGGSKCSSAQGALNGHYSDIGSGVPNFC
ncbi:hypothetical protein DL93DRAFT_1618960 [Clavulina sp. PMI_390]|nr:hypothetical protein DL93DRAFT_1618960 [Clavulina sp. PMI_390]